MYLGVEKNEEFGSWDFMTFSWEVIEFQGKFLKIQIYFDNAEYIS